MGVSTMAYRSRTGRFTAQYWGKCKMATEKTQEKRKKYVPFRNCYWRVIGNCGVEMNSGVKADTTTDGMLTYGRHLGMERKGINRLTGQYTKRRTLGRR
jgi:hypothetical protein